MPDIHPLKYVLDTKGDIIALSEMAVGDTIPKKYLNLSVEIDGGGVRDTFSHLMEQIDGGQFTDTFDEEAVEYSGGQI